MDSPEVSAGTCESSCVRACLRVRGSAGMRCALVSLTACALVCVCACVLVRLCACVRVCLCACVLVCLCAYMRQCADTLVCPRSSVQWSSVRCSGVHLGEDVDELALLLVWHRPVGNADVTQLAVVAELTLHTLLPAMDRREAGRMGGHEMK